LSILHNWYPKHSRYSSLSNYRLLSDCNENFRSRGDKRKRCLDSSMRAGDKFASLESAPLIFTRAATITIKLLSDTENKTESLDPVGADKSNTGVVAHSHSSPWNFQILKLREIQKREACIQPSGADKSQMRELHSYGCCWCCYSCCCCCCWWVRIELLVLVQHGCLAHITSLTEEKYFVGRRQA
jgi:hypothetical protein